MTSALMRQSIHAHYNSLGISANVIEEFCITELGQSHGAAWIENPGSEARDPDWVLECECDWGYGRSSAACPVKLAILKLRQMQVWQRLEELSYTRDTNALLYELFDRLGRREFIGQRRGWQSLTLAFFKELRPESAVEVTEWVLACVGEGVLRLDEFGRYAPGSGLRNRESLPF